MLPFVFEWHWDLGRIIFMGLFYAMVGLVSLGVGFALVKTFLDLIHPEKPHYEKHSYEL